MTENLIIYSQHLPRIPCVDRECRPPEVYAYLLTYRLGTLQLVLLPRLSPFTVALTNNSQPPCLPSSRADIIIGRFDSERAGRSWRVQPSLWQHV